MRLVLYLLLICVIAAGVGLGLTAAAVRHPIAMSLIEDGPWRAMANEGTPDVDAYALAALSHRGEAPLAIAEGLTFRARTDDDGNTLDSACTYQISGTVPAVRAWSLAAFDAAGRPFSNPAQRFGYSNADAIRDSNGAVQITLSRSVSPGNWIPVSAPGGLVIVLRLYDTTAAAISGGRSAPELPSIKRLGCG